MPKKPNIKIGIIGAGFTGLAAGFKLAQYGYNVTVIETNNIPGGLAIGFKNKNLKWDLEEHYHHLFKTDYAIQNLAKEINFNITYKRPKTSTYYKGNINQIDSPLNLLKFKHLTIFDRLRTGAVLAYLKLTNSWEGMEKITAEQFLINSMGKNSWKILWEPLMKKKFGKYASKIPASWFWARVKSRTMFLGYPEGGFKNFAQKIEKKIIEKEGVFLYNTKVLSINRKKKRIVIQTYNNKSSKLEKHEFDKVICTLPTKLFVNLTKGLPKKYINQTKYLTGIGATNLVLTLKKSFLIDGTYWLNINEEKFPFLCIVEHTNFISSKKYNKDTIIYIGNYLPSDHKYFRYSPKKILKEYLPFLKIINKDFKLSSVKQMKFFKAPFAQPIVTKNYSKKIPSIKTPIDGLYLANIQQVYPWDRGTNYAVDLGNRVADIILESYD